MFDSDLLLRAARLISLCEARALKISSAESCTGGLVAALLTEIAGSSAVFERGFVTYSNAAKVELIGVPVQTISQFGAVSEETARAMAAGALAHSSANIAVAITGIAGPGGGTSAKPVGLVHIASAAVNGRVIHARHLFDGNRAEVRLSAVKEALATLESQATFWS